MEAVEIKVKRERDIDPETGRDRVRFAVRRIDGAREIALCWPGMRRYETKREATAVADLLRGIYLTLRRAGW